MVVAPELGIGDKQSAGTAGLSCGQREACESAESEAQASDITTRLPGALPDQSAFTGDWGNNGQQSPAPVITCGDCPHDNANLPLKTPNHDRPR